MIRNILLAFVVAAASALAAAQEPYPVPPGTGGIANFPVPYVAPSARAPALDVARAFTAGNPSGVLTRVERFAFGNFIYPTELSATRGDLAAHGEITLRAQFIWRGGLDGRAIEAPQHTVLAFTNHPNPTMPLNDAGQRFWTHGAGVVVGKEGLGLELWFQEPNGPRVNAYFWDQSNNRCLTDVLGTITTPVLCLSDQPSAGSYITTAPAFTLRTGIPYELRMSIQRVASSQWAVLTGQLYENTGYFNRLVQSGSVGFEFDRFFPAQDQMLEASVARTGGSAAEHSVEWKASR